MWVETIGERVKFARDKRGLSLPDLAREVSKYVPGGSIAWQTIQDLESGKSRGTKHVLAFAKALQVRPEWLNNEEGSMDAPGSSRLREITHAPSLEPDRIPVLGTAEGGEEGWALWNGDVIDHVPRPPSLLGAPNAYACYVTGTSMEPRYHPGELIYVHPGKPVTIGSYVLVQARPRAEGEPPRAVVKRLAKRLAMKLVLEQYNPPKTIEVQTKDVVSIHRIMGSGE